MKSINPNCFFFLLINVERALQFGGQLPATFLASMLRLGRKYGFATFEKAALGRLHHDCPTKLFLWDFLELESRRQIDFDHNPEDIISIAHEFRLFTTLPAAYAKYLQCRTLVTFFSHKNDFSLIISLNRRE